MKPSTNIASVTVLEQEVEKGNMFPSASSSSITKMSSPSSTGMNNNNNNDTVYSLKGSIFLALLCNFRVIIFGLSYYLSFIENDPAARLFMTDILFGSTIFFLFLIPKKFWPEKLKIYRSLFWIGVSIGASWEFSFFLLGPNFGGDFYWINDQYWPLPMIFIPFIHSIWDGALFLFGIGMVQLCLYPFSGTKLFIKFSWKELLIFIFFEQLQEIVLEYSAIMANAWYYIPSKYNPCLIWINDITGITLDPQLIWFFAPMIFYSIVLKLKNKSNGKSKSKDINNNNDQEDIYIENYSDSKRRAISLV